MELKELIGVTIYKVTKNRDQIILDTDAGQFSLEAYGDCCSTTWIESIDNEDALIGTVQEACNIPMPDLGTPEECECREYYGLKIVTNKGRAVIDYRNDSNGYYGGSLDIYKL